jgi:ubiquinone/menaquinone biosynthesis C-methylase UbiE
MGFYRRQVVPRIIKLACGMKTGEPYRARACAGLEGRVLEVGFGSGLNIPFYPEAVTSVTAVEPSDVAWKLGAEGVAKSRVPIERGGLDGESLPFPDDSHDTALSTWTLCTIPDVGRALREIHRVLVPGGTLHFVDHGLAPDAGVQAWQRRLDPLEQLLFGGCHLTRRIPALIESAGFEIKELDTFYEKGAPKFLAADSLGVAVAR